MALTFSGEKRFSSNFNIEFTRPLDARLVVDDVANLTDGSIAYPYKGMVVTIAGTSDLWVLIETTTTTDGVSNWRKVSGSSDTSASAAGLVIEGDKLYLVDSSNTKINADGLDISSFTKDGFLDSVSLDTNDDSDDEPALVFVWNTSAGKNSTRVSLSGIISNITKTHTSSSTTYLTIDDTTNDVTFTINANTTGVTSNDTSDSKVVIDTTVTDGVYTINAAKKDLQNIINSIPTTVSDLENDANYITIDALADYAKTEDIPTVPTNVSAFDNDANYITIDALNDYVKTSDLENFLTPDDFDISTQDAATFNDENGAITFSTESSTSDSSKFAMIEHVIGGDKAVKEYVDYSLNWHDIK